MVVAGHVAKNSINFGRVNFYGKQPSRDDPAMNMERVLPRSIPMSAMFSMIVLRMKACPQHSTGKEGVTISLIVNANHQFIFPALMKFDGLFFQFADGVQHFTPFFQQHLSGAGKAGPVARAIEDLDIQIAFQFMNRVAQR